MNKNECYDISIDDLTVDGNGIGRVEGMAVFTPNILPGETGTVKIIKIAKNYAIGRVEKFTQKSEERVIPACKCYKFCGGCSLQHLSYDGQLWAKWKHVQNCIKKIGGIKTEVLFPLASDNEYHYRNKTAFPVGTGEDGRIQIGCYQRHSHKIVDTDTCLLQDDNMDKVIGCIRNFLMENKVQPYNEETGKGLVRHLIVRKTAPGEIMVALVINGERIPHEEKLIAAVTSEIANVTSIVINENKNSGNVILGRKTKAVFGRDRIREKILNVEYDISVNSFLQVNHDQTEKLYAKVLELAAVKPQETVLDLYCGAGAISLQLAGAAKKVYGIEIIPQAIEDAEANAKLNHIGNVEFVLGDCSEKLPQMGDILNHTDVIVVDPPRKGLEKNTIDVLLASSAKRLVYVSCDPATLARDLKQLSEGFEVKTIQPVDMFPQTMHVETVVLMSRD